MKRGRPTEEMRAAGLTITAQKPWKKLKISRSQFYKRKKAGKL